MKREGAADPTPARPCDEVRPGQDAESRSAPLAAMQMRFLDRVVPQLGLSIRMCVTSARLVGRLDVARMWESLEAVVRRNDALRTRIVTVNDVPRQVVDTQPADQMQLIDAEAECSALDAEETASRLAQKFLDERFELSIGPLFAARLFRLSERDHVLVVGVDHMISDDLTCEIIRNEIWAHYNRTANTRPLADEARVPQFFDYASWQQRMHADWVLKHGAYWTDRLEGALGLQIPTAGNPTTAMPLTAALLHLPLGKKLSIELDDLAQREQIKLPLVVFAVYALVLSRWCERQDLVFEFVMHGRNHQPGLDRMIGYFAYPLHLRLDIGSSGTFLDLLRQVNVEFSTARKHEDFGQVFQLRPDFRSSLSFNWLVSKPKKSSESPGEFQDQLKLLPVRANYIWPVRFATFFFTTAAGIGVSVHYRPDLFSLQSVQRFGANLRSTAARCVADPCGCVSRAFA